MRTVHKLITLFATLLLLLLLLLIDIWLCWYEWRNNKDDDLLVKIRWHFRVDCRHSHHHHDHHDRIFDRRHRHLHHQYCVLDHRNRHRHHQDCVVGYCHHLIRGLTMLLLPPPPLIMRRPLYQMLYCQSDIKEMTDSEWWWLNYSMRVIKKYTGCDLNQKKSKLPDLRLATVYEFVTNSPLENAHNSLVDCMAQGDIIMSNQFKTYLDKKESICTIESVWSKKEQNREAKNNFPDKSLRELWKLKDDSGKLIIKNPSRGCTNCNVAVCQEHWDSYQHWLV